MIKYFNLLTLSVIFISLNSLKLHADDFDLLVSGGENFADECILECHNHYNTYKNLTNFNYSPDMTTKVAKYFEQSGLDFNTAKEEPKDAYCDAARQSLTECYAKSSATYSMCKLAAQKFTTWITKDPSWKDYFASCKNICRDNLKEICPDK